MLGGMGRFNTFQINSLKGSTILVLGHEILDAFFGVY